MAKSDTLAPSTITARARGGKLTPRDLIALSDAELARRELARRELAVGTWAVVKDAALAKELCEDVVQIVGASGSTRQIKTFINPMSPRNCEVSALAMSLALGDHVKRDGKFGVVAVGPIGSGFGAYALTPDWGLDGFGADQPSLAAEVFLDQTGDRMVEGANLSPASSLISEMTSPRCSNDERGLFVRGYRNIASTSATTAPIAGNIGPGLSVEQFNLIAACGEPCRPRRDGGVVVVDKMPQGDAILVDFLGGATLWIWAGVLVDNTICEISWADSPSANHHPPTAEILKPSTLLTADAALTHQQVANEHAARRKAIAPTPESTNPVPALEEGAHMTPHSLDTILSAALQPTQTIVILRDDYDDRLATLLKTIRETWGEHDLADIADELSSLENEIAAVGAYQVRGGRMITLPDGRGLALQLCAVAGSRSTERYLYVAGLLEHVSSQALARSDDQQSRGVGESVARIAKGTASKAFDLARDGAVALKDHAVETVQRKGTALAAGAFERTIVSAQETARDTTLAIAGAISGMEDPASLARNPAAQHGFDAASVGGMRFAAKLLSKALPTVARGLSAAADTLEEGIDRKQADKVLDTVTPVMTGGFKALAAAGVARFFPALAAPTQAPAIPEKTPDPTAPLPASAPAAESASPAPRKPRAKRKPTASSGAGGAT